MFKLSTTARVKSPVKVKIEDETGAIEEHEFSATFKVMPISRTTDVELNSDEGQRAFLSEAIIGLDDIVDDAGNPEPFSRELVSALLDRVELRLSLMDAYSAATRKAAKGN